MLKLRPALYLGVLLALILSATCASPPENLVILVSVKGLTADVVALSVDLTLNGTKTQHADVKNNLSEFALTLPNRDDQRGLLEISATATSTALCRVSNGTTRLSIDAGTFYMVELSLSAQPTPQCALTLDVTGPGTVNVMAGSATRMCSGHCVFDYPVGTNVILNALTTSVSVPQKWSGDCGGPATTPCSLVTQKPNTVAVTFTLFCFGTAASMSVGTTPQSGAVGDFNGDGKLDLAVSNFGSNNVSILLGNGMGGFAAAGGSPLTVGSTPYPVAVGDFNGDTKLDLAVANDVMSGTVNVFVGNGMGGFAAANGSPFAVGIYPFSVAVGDFNRDTKLDLAVANFGGNNVSVLLGNGMGGFAAASGSPIAVGTGPQSVVVGDFNSDTQLDLAVANSGSNNVSVLLGNGMGGFNANGSPVGVGTDPRFVAAGDLNGDGKLDLAVANHGSNTVSVLLGSGTGVFAKDNGSPIAVGAGPILVSVGNFNGDNKLDLAVTNYSSSNVSILLNQSTASVACQ